MISACRTHFKMTSRLWTTPTLWFSFSTQTPEAELKFSSSDGCKEFIHYVINTNKPEMFLKKKNFVTREGAFTCIVLIKQKKKKLSCAVLMCLIVNSQSGLTLSRWFRDERKWRQMTHLLNVRRRHVNKGLFGGR